MTAQEDAMNAARPLSEHVAELEHRLDAATVARDTLEVFARNLRITCDELSAENAELRAGRGKWPADKPDEARLPRVISAGELREGQWVAWQAKDLDTGEPKSFWAAGLVSVDDQGRTTVRYEHGGRSNVSVLAHVIVLLKDTPTSGEKATQDSVGMPLAPETVKALRDIMESRTTTITETDPDPTPAKSVDTSSATVEENGGNFAHQTPERLTVADLDAAPSGSELSLPEPKSWRKAVKTKRMGSSALFSWRMGGAFHSSQDILRILGWGDATLACPEKNTADPKPEPWLTVHQLNVAPAGSALNEGAGKYRELKKDEVGIWRSRRTGNPHTEEKIVEMTRDWVNSTLTHPGE